MSEYMEKHSVARLIGAPPGYVGYEEGGALTEAVRRRPYQVVLFDEIEKAHPDVFNVLLQVLDDGRLTDGQGRTVDFRNVLIIMTSNLGSEYLVNLREGEDTKTVEKEVMGVVRGHFRPEFLNRVDEIILFHRLRREDMSEIVDIQLKRLNRLLEDRKIGLSLDAKARQWLADKKGRLARGAGDHRGVAWGGGCWSYQPVYNSSGSYVDKPMWTPVRSPLARPAHAMPGAGWRGRAMPCRRGARATPSLSRAMFHADFSTP